MEEFPIDDDDVSVDVTPPLQQVVELIDWQLAALKAHGLIGD